MDAVACIVTFTCAITLGMEYGIMIGVITSIAVILIKMLRPHIHLDVYNEESTNTKYILVKPDSGMNFPSVDYIRSSISKITGKQHQNISILALNLERCDALDYTSVTALTSLVKSCHREEKTIIFVNLSRKWEAALKDAGLDEMIVCSSYNIGDCIRKLNHFEKLISTSNGNNIDVRNGELEKLNNESAISS